MRLVHSDKPGAQVEEAEGKPNVPPSRLGDRRDGAPDVAQSAHAINAWQRPGNDYRCEEEHTQVLIPQLLEALWAEQVYFQPLVTFFPVKN